MFACLLPSLHESSPFLLSHILFLIFPILISVFTGLHGLVDILFQDFRVVSAGFKCLMNSTACFFFQTRSGRGFSPWEGETINVCSGFDIATAVVTALDSEQHEDLAEPDTTDDDLSALAATLTVSSVPDTPNTSTTPESVQSSGSRKARDKAGSKARRQAARKASKVNDYINLLPPSRRPKHVKTASPIKTKFALMKHRVASTGWIGLRDDGQSEQEKAVDFEEPGWTPSHRLSEFFGKQRRFNGFQYVKYLGPCVFSTTPSL